MLLLDHVGSKSGRKRTIPPRLFGRRRGPRHSRLEGRPSQESAWFHNLRANPQLGSGRRTVLARVATAAERERLWPMGVQAYSGYAGYQERTEREIPLVILEPR
jgi:F420H(2)-dependent quinone reductase